MTDSPRPLKRPLRLHGLRPGDLLGFAECSPTGAAIRICTGGLICCGGLSHVAIVTWWHRRWVNPERRLVLCESTSLGSRPCLIQGKIVRGVQVHHVRAKILEYRGRVYHFPLAQALDWEGTQRLYRFCKRHLGVEYDYADAAHQRHTPLARLLMRLRGEDLSRVDCSEFSAACHEACGVADLGNASRYSPRALVRWERRAGILGQPKRLK